MPRSTWLCALSLLTSPCSLLAPLVSVALSLLCLRHVSFSFCNFARNSTQLLPLLPPLVLLPRTHSTLHARSPAQFCYYYYSISSERAAKSSWATIVISVEVVEEEWKSEELATHGRQ